MGQDTSLQAGPTASRPTYRLIQVLRAIAALMVVLHHATITLLARNHFSMTEWINGASGVDIFFVISGFVMTISSAPLRSATHPARTFLARRIERVVPMYWIVTAVKVAVLLVVPAWGLNGLGTPGHVLGSFLFIPSFNPTGALEPVVVVGWTLNFEMAFYVLFAVALALRVRLLWIITPPLLCFALFRVFHPPAGPMWVQFFESTLVLEFLLGVLLGLALPWVRRLPWPLGLMLLVGGFLPLLLWAEPNFDFWRGVRWGVPALAVVAGALSLEHRWGARSPRWALELGDASYSIYLVHTFALPAVAVLLPHVVRHAWRGEIAVSMAIMLVVSAAAGEVAYRLVERPITDWFKGRRRTAIPAVA